MEAHVGVAARDRHNRGASAGERPVSPRHLNTKSGALVADASVFVVIPVRVSVSP
jgi:hypothetical protein